MGASGFARLKEVPEAAVGPVVDAAPGAALLVGAPRSGVAPEVVRLVAAGCSRGGVLVLAQRPPGLVVGLERPPLAHYHRGWWQWWQSTAGLVATLRHGSTHCPCGRHCH